MAKHNQIRLRVVFFRPNMKPQLYYIPADAHKRKLTMGIQYFVSLSREKLDIYFQNTTRREKHCETAIYKTVGNSLIRIS